MATAKTIANKTHKVIDIKVASKPVTAWSFSRYNDYRACPLKFKLKHIDRIKEPPSEAMDKGSKAHDDAEAYIRGTLKKLPDVLAGHKSEFDMMKAMYKAKKLPMVLEDNWAFTADWQATEWDNWAECWVRIKLDAAHYIEPNLMLVTDWKTGKPNDYKVTEYLEQLELYAVAALLMAKDPDTKIRVRLCFVETGDTIAPHDDDGEEIVYSKKELPGLTKTWNTRVRPMMKSTVFPPRANSGCRFCFFGQAGKAKGGPGLCQF